VSKIEIKLQSINNNNNGEHLYSAFPHSSKYFDTHYFITLIDQVSIWNHLNFLGSIQSNCLLGAQRLAFWQYRALSDIGYPFTAAWTGDVLTRFDPGNFRTASEWSHHCTTVFPNVPLCCSDTAWASHSSLMPIYNTTVHKNKINVALNVMWLTIGCLWRHQQATRAESSFCDKKCGVPVHCVNRQTGRKVKSEDLRSCLTIYHLHSDCDHWSMQ